MRFIARISTVAGAALLCAAPVFADIAAGVAALEKNDPVTAAKAFQAEFDAGNADGAFYLGRMYELGLGTNPDLVQASALYKLGANKNSPMALNRLGLMYLDGQTVIRDFQKGAELICKAADLGESNAQFNCGASYADGRGVAKDPVKALEYWQKATDQNHIAATNYVALAHKQGSGVEVDAAKAFELFLKTAEEGNAMGLYEVALALETGSGVDADISRAYTYANIAAARSHPDAPALRDRLEAKLTPEEVTTAQIAARDWLAAAEAKAALPADAP